MKKKELMYKLNEIKSINGKTKLDRVYPFLRGKAKGEFLIRLIKLSPATLVKE